MPVFRCPHCQQTIETAPQFGGVAVACPYCRGPVIAPLELASVVPQEAPAYPAPFVTGRARRRKRQEWAKLAVVLGAAGIIAAILIGALLHYREAGADSPAAAYRQIMGLMAKDRWEEFYDRLDHASQARMEIAVDVIAAFAGNSDLAAELVDQRSDGDARGKFCRMMRAGAARHGTRRAGEVLSTSYRGPRAILKVQSEGEVTEVEMLREDGIWKLSMPKR